MRTKRPPELESKIVKSTIVRLRRLGIVLYRRNAGAFAMEDGVHKRRWIRAGAPGQSDLYGWVIKTGRHVEIEVKRPPNEPTELQLAWLKESHRLGAIAFWGDDVNVIERVAEAVLAGGKIKWLDGCNFDVEDRCSDLIPLGSSSFSGIRP